MESTWPKKGIERTLSDVFAAGTFVLRREYQPHHLMPGVLSQRIRHQVGVCNRLPNYVEPRSLVSTLLCWEAGKLISESPKYVTNT